MSYLISSADWFKDVVVRETLLRACILLKILKFPLLRRIKAYSPIELIL